MPRLALIFGGRSAEHEISLASARFVAEMLADGPDEVVPVGIARDGRWLLPADPEAAFRDGLESVAAQPVHLVVDPSAPALACADGRRIPIDFAFPVLHGPYGEDGTIQGLLELAGLAYAGAGVAASAVGMDKELMKAAFAARRLPQVDHLVFRGAAATAPGAVAAAEERLGYPMFVKPANLGSSVGMTKAHDRDELAAALALAAAYDRKVVVEAACDARELECAVLGNDDPRASVVGEVVPANEFYDYEAKYTPGKMTFVIPADLPPAVSEAAADLALRAYRAIDCCGYARCDLFYERGSGRLLVNEINTIPGMTAMSGFPRLWAASGLDGRELVRTIVDLGRERHAARARLRATHGR